MRSSIKASHGDGAGMKLKRITIELDVSTIQQILAIDIDDDAERALDVMKRILAIQVKKPCNPIEYPFARPVTDLVGRIFFAIDLLEMVPGDPSVVGVK